MSYADQSAAEERIAARIDDLEARLLVLDAKLVAVEKQRDDLALIARRLLLKLRSHGHRGDAIAASEEYLKRHGLMGSPLREG